jgi:hypothetical protein
MVAVHSSRLARASLWFAALPLIGLSVARLPVAAVALPVCDPEYDPSITPPAAAISGWPARPATTPEIIAYVTAIDAQADRVITRQFATSWNGTPLYYSLVGDAATLADPEGVAAVQQELRDPRRTAPARAAEIAAGSPAIAWYAANVHGNEPSGADAALQLLYELAARTDCTGEALRSRLLVVIVATQNPDGRDANTRVNPYGFDMNRDWLARTQPETGGKLTVLAQYPPVLLVDAHEMLGSSFFFPPNADPVYHEMSPQALHWINEVYGTALQQTFEQHQMTEPQQWSYFNYRLYDFFGAYYGDTVPTLAFTAAGMTFEKGQADAYEQLFTEHFVAGWSALLTAAENKEQILQQYYAAHEQALADGRDGVLEANAVQSPRSTLVTQVPDIRIRHYFIGTQRAADDADRLVARLRALGVEVYRLDEPLQVPHLHEYGSVSEPRVLPAGTYWIPMEQPQKRWIQAVLGEQPYPSIPYFYDVAAWSNPLLLNLEARFTGDELAPAASLVTDVPRPDVEPSAFHWLAGDTARAVGAALALADEGVDVFRLPQPEAVGETTLPAGAFVLGGEPGAISPIAARFGVSVHGSSGALPSGLAVSVPRVAVFDPGPTGNESYDHLRFFLDRVLELHWTPITAAEVAGGRLAADRFDVFVVPGVYAALLEGARPQIRSWIEAGGVFVGTARPGGTGGTPFAIASGWSSAQLLSPPELDVPGSLMRVVLQPNSPVTLGAGDVAYWFHLGEQVLSPSTTGVNAALFPSTACYGDCGNDSAVSVDELLTLVDIALGNAKVNTCSAGDINRDDHITVDEILMAVNSATHGCAGALWFSGYAVGVQRLVGSAALVVEQLGAGHVVLFSGEPNFRAWTDGTQFLLANALVYPKAAVGSVSIDVRSRQASAAVAQARASVGPSIGPGRPIRIRVPAAQAEEALAVVRRFTAAVTQARSGETVVLQIANPQGLAADEHPFARLLLPALAEAGVEVLYAAL